MSDRDLFLAILGLANEIEVNGNSATLTRTANNSQHFDAIAGTLPDFADETIKLRDSNTIAISHLGLIGEINGRKL